MSIPSGITTCTVYINAPVSFIGAPGRVHLTITPSEQLVHAATGTPLVNFVDTIAPAEGASATIVLPHTDQPGFLDDSGAAYTNWYYTADVKYEKDGQFFQFPQRTFQIATGQDELDLALVQSGQPAIPVTAPTADVLSVNGKTGIVVLDKTDAQLDQVDNTSDADKPVSTAQQAALDTKEPVITPADVAKYYRGDKTWATLDKTAAGLGNVDNTSDVNKPVSTAQQAALDAKAPLESPTFTGTVAGISKSMVGLGNVDNTSDTNKPVSTAQQTALNAKVDTASKGAANGVASLGADSKVISTQIPDLSGSYLALGQRGAANGVASLDSSSKILPAQLPASYQRGVANGLASLDGTTKIPDAQMPASYGLFVPRWQPNTAYTAGQQVVGPSDEIVSAKTAHTSGSTFNPANWNLGSSAAAKGLVYHVATTTTSSAFVAWTVINNFASFTFKAGRNYRIVWDGHHQSSVDSDHIDMQITSAAVADAAGSVTGLTVLRQKTFDCHGANAINVHILEARVTYPVDTTLQIKFVAQRATGSGNILMVGSTLDTMYYQIFDDGAQI